MAHGEIAQDKTRMSLVIPKELKGKLNSYAYQDGRSLNNLIVKVLTDYTLSRSINNPELTQPIKK